jgi:hypothetical protein
VEKQTVKTYVHGVNRYRKYGCRCDICRSAASALKRLQRVQTTLPVQPLIDKFGDVIHRRFYRSLDKWHREGVNPYVADKICCSLGCHPAEVYGDDWFEPMWKKDRVS